MLLNFAKLFLLRGPTRGKVHRYLLKIRFSMKFLNSTWNRLRYKIRLNSCKMSTQNEDLTSSFPISILHNNRKKKSILHRKFGYTRCCTITTEMLFAKYQHTEKIATFFSHKRFSNTFGMVWCLFFCFFYQLSAKWVSHFFFERGFRNINASQLRI